MAPLLVALQEIFYNIYNSLSIIIRRGYRVRDGAEALPHIVIGRHKALARKLIDLNHLVEVKHARTLLGELLVEGLLSCLRGEGEI